MATPRDNPLGTFLRDRRARLDPAAFGFGLARRRTPGLRREEVARRADVSPIWYTLLEQGRGGAPSANVLHRVAGALTLTPAEREHLFLLARRPQPAPRYQAPAGVTPGLQRALDALEMSPALVKTATWDVVAWNRAAATVLTDYAALPARERNVLRLLFGDPQVRARLPEWEREARFAVARFRLETTRAGVGEAADRLVDELCAASPEFATLWAAQDVSHHGEGTKHIVHPGAGPLALEYASFGVDGQPGLGLVIYTPATALDRERVGSIVEGRAAEA